MPGFVDQAMTLHVNAGAKIRKRFGCRPCDWHKSAQRQRRLREPPIHAWQGPLLRRCRIHGRVRSHCGDRSGDRGRGGDRRHVARSRRGNSRTQRRHAQQQTAARCRAPSRRCHAGAQRCACWCRAGTEKAWPKEIDEWTHYYYDAKGNAVSKDKQVGPAGAAAMGGQSALVAASRPHVVGERAGDERAGGSTTSWMKARASRS